MSKGGVQKRGKITLRDALGERICPICGSRLVDRLDQGWRIAQLPDGKYYCQMCAYFVRRAVYE
jgi:RNase P subunit RPR2